jgi:prepilin signal peptidase PulO-like enzyme (type II secretory pathway)
MVVVGLAIAGLVLGSFVNAVVSRLPHLDGSVLWGRSRCPRCHTELAAWDLVPVLSWLLLRGRCRYCGARIEDGPLVEIAIPALFVISYLLWPGGVGGFAVLPFAVWLVFGACLIGLVAYRFR